MHLAAGVLVLLSVFLSEEREGGHSNTGGLVFMDLGLNGRHGGRLG